LTTQSGIILKKAIQPLYCAGILAVFLAGSAGAQGSDPPTRVARLNYVAGNVSMQPGGAGDWTPAEPNRPFTTGDQLFTDIDSKAELHTDLGVLRLGQQTTATFLTLNDQAVQISVTEGDFSVTLRQIDPNQTVEIDTPNAAVSLLRPGIYRFRVSAADGLSFVVVRQGQAEITGGGQAFTLNPGNSAAVTGTGSLSSNVAAAPDPDDFDRWSATRDAQEGRLASARYLPRTVVGYEDLDQYGSWDTVESYGAVWYPRTVVAGWAPYHYGHWAWIEPWGWTWIDDTPWGFAPFHYGRWALIGGRWGWCPGPIVVVANRPAMVRPVYAPALVAWFGGAHWGVSIGVGAAPTLGWVALGIGEIYTPAYHCSPHYFSGVNVSNTTIVKTVNITNVYNNVYVNKTVYNQTYVNIKAPNGVSAMPQEAFANGRPVRTAGIVVSNEQLRTMQPQAAAMVAPPVAPTRQALLASNVNRPVVRPPQQMMARKVMMRAAPAAAPAPFAARQAYLQQHAGQPHDFTAMHAQVAVQTPALAAIHGPPAAAHASQPVAQAAPAVVPPPAIHESSPALHTQPKQPAPAAHVNQPASRPVQHDYPAKQVEASHPKPPPPHKDAAHEHKEKPSEKKERDK
jgi:hypothetical protein